ncbi:MAG: hypothetical protein E7678_07815 [Ruminococcaceae bacterium]|nr:hypothetical protein [Oscillospiraceae bacterium]
MKSYKVLFSIGCVVIALIVCMIIGAALHEKTVDFNGRVIEITDREGGSYVLRAESVAGGEFSFIIDGRSDLKNCCDKDITVDEISVSGIVLINYRNSLFKKNEMKTVKNLTYFIGSEKTNGN